MRLVIGRNSGTNRRLARLRDAALDDLCDVLDQVEPTAPTLCEGFDAHELAIHVWQISHDPLAWPGMVMPRFAHLSARRAARVRRRFRHPVLVEQLRTGPRQPTALKLDPTPLHALGEYWIHLHDVARPNGIALPAPSAELEDALWQRVRDSAEGERGRDPLVRLRRTDGAQVTVGRGDGPIRVVTGEASELLLWVYGREHFAEVTELAPVWS